jgi:hypothetical protein
MSTTVSVYLPDKADRRRVRRAAKLAGKPPATFMRDAVLAVTNETIEKHDKQCPHCGAERSKAA